MDNETPQHGQGTPEQAEDSPEDRPGEPGAEGGSENADAKVPFHPRTTTTACWGTPISTQTPEHTLSDVSLPRLGEDRSPTSFEADRSLDGRQHQPGAGSPSPHHQTGNADTAPGSRLTEQTTQPATQPERGPDLHAITAGRSGLARRRAVPSHDELTIASLRHLLLADLQGLR
jgi:hypothetical protein